MAKPITIPNTFASATSAIPLSQLDQDFSTLANATNDLATYSNYVADTGAADAYIANFPANTNTASLTAGLTIQFKAANANTGASTLNVQVNGSTIGTAAIRYANGSALAAGAIAAGAMVSVMYDGTNFQLINDPAGQSGGDVTGPASATDNAIARFDGTSGKLIQNSVVTIADTTGDMSGVGTLSAGNVTVSGTANAATLIVTGNSTLGDASGDTLTITGTTVTTPNGLNFDSNTLVIDAANNRVGVNNATPTTALDVTGTATISTNLAFTGTGNRITGDFSNATASNRVAFQSSTTNGNTGVYVIPNGTGTNANITVSNNSAPDNSSLGQITVTQNDFRIVSGAIGTGTLLPLIMLTGGSERLRIDTSGNVGIGTTGGSFRLNVVDASSATRVYIANSANAAGGAGIYMQVLNGASVVADNTIRSDNTGNMSFFTGTSSGSERMRITSAGNVGINTTSPTYSLQVDSSTANGIFVRDNNNSAAAPLVRVQGNRVDNNGSQTFSGGLVLERFNSNGSTGVVNGNWLGTIYFGGNYDATPNFTYSASIAAAAEANWTSTSAAAAGLAFLTGTSGTALGTANAGYGTERMRIGSDGNIMIGNAANPGNTLRFFDIYNNNTGAAAGSIIRLITSDVSGATTTSADLIKYKNGSFYLANNETNSAAFTAFTVGASERMRIDSSGNVLIGTTTTRNRLTVSSAAAATAPTLGTASGTVMFTNNDTSYGMMIGSNGGGQSWIQVQRVDSSATAYDLWLQPSGGNVGIGTSSPSAKLNVVGGTTAALVVAGGASSTIRNTASSGSSWFVGTNVDSYILHNESNTPMLFTTNGTERMRITSDGNLLIGTTANDNTSVGNKIQASGGAIFVQSSTGDGPLTQFNNINASITNGYRFASFRINSGATEKGTITYNTGTGQVNYNQTSDRRLKTNIKPAKEALSIVSQIKVVSFDMLSGGHTEYGVIAQDLKDIFPEAVSEGDSEKEVQKAWGVDTSNLVPALVKAIQEQQAMIVELTNRIKKLEGA